jgi:hypothetical protein
VTSMATVMVVAMIATTVMTAMEMMVALMMGAAVMAMATEMAGMAGITTMMPKPMMAHRQQQQGRPTLDVHLRGINPVQFNNQPELEMFGMIDHSKPQ